MQDFGKREGDAQEIRLICIFSRRRELQCSVRSRHLESSSSKEESGATWVAQFVLVKSCAFEFEPHILSGLLQSTCQILWSPSLPLPHLNAPPN